MQREEFLVLSGQKLNELTAEVVMEWQKKLTTDGSREYWGDGSSLAGPWVEASRWGFAPQDHENVWNPAINLLDAWYIFPEMKKRIFSTRLRFSKELSSQVRGELGVNVAWPDALYYMKPYHICRAALIALLVREVVANGCINCGTATASRIVHKHTGKSDYFCDDCATKGQYRAELFEFQGARQV